MIPRFWEGVVSWLSSIKAVRGGRAIAMCVQIPLTSYGILGWAPNLTQPLSPLSEWSNNVLEVVAIK